MAPNPLFFAAKAAEREPPVGCGDGGARLGLVTLVTLVTLAHPVFSLIVTTVTRVTSGIYKRVVKGS